MSKKTIFFVMNDLLIGGAQKLFIEIANTIQKEGEYQVVLIGLFNFKEKKNLAHYIDKSVLFYQVDFKTIYNFFGWYRYIRLMLTHKPKVIFSTLFFANVVTRVCSLFVGPKIFVVEQNTYDMKSTFHIFIDIALAYITPHIICTSKSVADFILNQTNIQKGKFEVIHSGVNCQMLLDKLQNRNKKELREMIGVPQEKFIFLSLARLTPQKNPHLLLESFAHFLLNTNNKDAYFLLIVGDGLIRGELEVLTEDLGIKNQVHFAGSVHDVWNYYGASDVFVSTSRIEGFSLVHAEAMVFGLPLVSTKTAGPDIMLVPERNGFFVESNVDSVSHGMQKITEVDYSEYSRYSKIRALDFSIEKTAMSYRDFAKKYGNI